MASITTNGITATLTFHDSPSWTLSITSNTNVASIKGTANDSTDHALMFNNQEVTVSFHKTFDRIYWTLRDNASCERGHIMLPTLKESEGPEEPWSRWVGKN